MLAPIFLRLLGWITMLARKQLLQRGGVTRLSSGKAMSLSARGSDFFKPRDEDTHIGKDGSFTGVVTHRGERLVVSGECVGSVMQTRRGAEVLLNSGACVNGIIQSTSVNSEGRVVGNISAMHVRIGEAGVMDGSVEYGTLEISGEIKSAVLKPRDYWSKAAAKGVTHI